MAPANMSFWATSSAMGRPSERARRTMRTASSKFGVTSTNGEITPSRDS
jgi:hypothetical protein